MKIDLSAENIFSEKCRDMIKTLKEDKLPIIICGNVDEKLYYDFFKINDVIPENVYDRSPELHGKKCRFGEIINVDDIECMYTDFNAVIVVPYFDEIKKVLESCSSRLHYAFFLDIAMLHSHPTMFLDGAKEKITEKKEFFEKFYGEFEDNVSKQTWEDLTNYWISGDYSLVEKYKARQSAQYLDFFEFGDNEIFLNCGSFDGRYTKKFITLVKRKYKRIINIECDDGNYQVLCKNMQGFSNIENIKVGLYNKKTVLHFNAIGNGMSCIEESGTENIDVDTIDNILSGERVSFIKMDIEGAEYAALEGAKKTIKKYLPKLAICIYHNIDDFIRIPCLISSFDSRYKFAVRHYTDTLTETVLFAWV